MKKLSLVMCLFILVAGFAVPAFALDLNEARQKGLLGEKADGYVGVVAADAEAKALAVEVNARRKEEYAKISAANGQPVSVVAKLAAVQVIGGLPSGALYQDASGGWAKK